MRCLWRMVFWPLQAPFGQPISTSNLLKASQSLWWYFNPSILVYSLAHSFQSEFVFEAIFSRTHIFI